MDRQRLKLLLTEYFANTISREACSELLGYLATAPPEQVAEVIDEVLALPALPSAPPFNEDRREALFGRLLKEVRQVQSVQRAPVSYWRRMAAVFIVTLAVGGVICYTAMQQQAPTVPLNQVAAGAADILLPDSGRAVLTLAGGKTIELNAGQPGIVVGEGIRYYDGTPVEGGEIASASPQIYQLSTPKGSSYQLTLPDGTKVWLNTASSITYPSAFQAGQRTVQMEGEAYFEVAHDSARPFIVEAGGSTVRVLGTHFNISAFKDEPQVTTTLVQGAVRVGKDGHSIQLKPGQQARVNRRTGAIERSAADIRGALAWKDGYFRFDNETLPEILAEISRWYDIEDISYEGVFPERFTGTFRRSKRVSRLFGHLEKLAPVKFEIHERRVKVMR